MLAARNTKKSPDEKKHSTGDYPIVHEVSLFG